MAWWRRIVRLIELDSKSKATCKYVLPLSIQRESVIGHHQSRIVFFLMNIHNRFRTIYFARVCPTLLHFLRDTDSWSGHSQDHP